jgi:Ser/Thr protein kinase RdoA (MazF antagonist)
MRLRAELAALPRDAASWGFIHGDLHPWNLLFTRDVAGAIDFSECGWGHRAFELASTLQWLRHPLAGNHDHGAGRARLQDALLEGYASIAALPGDVLRAIDLFIVLRLLLALEWILDDWPTLDHRPWGPGFITACEGLFESYERA